MNNFVTTPAQSTNIHFGLPKFAEKFGADTILLFQPNHCQYHGFEELRKAITSGNPAELEAAISAIMQKEQTPFVMSSIIAILGEDTNRNQIFQMMTTNQQKATEIIQNSYMHDNGFEKWVLFNNPKFKLRLHVYEDSRLIPLESRHNHSWDFASCIIEGTLQNTIYTIDSENGEEELLHYQYSPVEGESYDTKLIETSRLRKMTDINLSQGTAYFMPSSVIHRISYEQTFKQRTITLMMTGKRKNYNCDLFSERPFKERKTKVERFKPKDLQDRFNGLSTSQF